MQVYYLEVDDDRLLPNPCCYTFHVLGPVTFSDSELISGTLNRFREFDRTCWTGDQPIARPVPTQDNKTQKFAYIHASSGIRTQDHSRCSQLFSQLISRYVTM
jgi:hypothetical protein